MDDQNSNPTVISRRTLLGGVAAAAGVMIVPGGCWAARVTRRRATP